MAHVLKVTVSTSFGLSHAGAALADLVSARPDLDIQLLIEDRTLDLAAEGFDLGIRIGTSDRETLLATRRLCAIRRVPCASPAAATEANAPRTPADLHGARCFIYSRGEPRTTWTFRGQQGEESVEVVGAYRANSGIAVRDALVRGHGVGLLPTYIVGPDIRAGRLRRILPNFETATELSLYAAWPRESVDRPELRAAVDVLSTRFQDPPIWDDF